MFKNTISTKVENIMLDFLVEKAKETVQKLNLKKLWGDLEDSGKIDISADKMANHFQKKLAPRIHEMQLQTDIKKLRNRADVEVDRDGAISRYTPRRSAQKRKLREEAELTIDGTVPMPILIRPIKTEPDSSYELSEIKNEEEQKYDPGEMGGMMEMFMNSLKEMLDTQTMLMERLLDKEEPVTSKKQILHSIRTLILTLNHSELSGALQKVDKAIQKLEEHDEKIAKKKARSLIDSLVGQFIA
ncbi:unnamed protein product [Caenorhabditis sp. 36 PRJEB53466]|nr:unnamed protein product [Caenorhabditis sp. 36 PRJEB53466]